MRWKPRSPDGKVSSPSLCWSSSFQALIFVTPMLELAEDSGAVPWQGPCLSPAWCQAKWEAGCSVQG